MTLNVDAAREDGDRDTGRDPNGGSGRSAQRRLVDELLDEMTSIRARDRMRTVDLFPSILSALGKIIPAGIDGETVAIE